MNKMVADIRPEVEVADPLAKLRAPFPPNQISKLPKPFKKDAPKGKCAECGGYHGLPAMHLDYVGHAALTDRLLDTDPLWSWEPVGFAPDGLPAFDRNGGLWIKLTVCGVTRLGYGNAEGKSGGDAVKEIIGDALRNAAMRFGAALDLWHKGDLHVTDQGEGEPLASAEELATNHLRSCALDRATFTEAWNKNKAGWRDVLDDAAYRRVVDEMKRLAAKLADAEKQAETEAKRHRTAAEENAAAIAAIGDDEIPHFD